MLEGVHNALLKGQEIEEGGNKNLAFDLISKGSLPNWLVSLQNHMEFQVYQKAYQILEGFFQCDAE